MKTIKLTKEQLDTLYSQGMSKKKVTLRTYKIEEPSNK